MYSYQSVNDADIHKYYTRKFAFRKNRTAKRRKSLECCGHPSCHLDKYNLISNARTNPVRPFTVYKILVSTADVPNAGTSADIYITLKGEYGSAVRQRLRKYRQSASNVASAIRLEPGSTHTFEIMSPDLGEIRSVVVEHDSARREDGWLLESIQIIHPPTKRHYMFLCNHWLSLNKEDGLIVRELFGVRSAKTKYAIMVVTGNDDDCGTDSNVYITIYGRTGVTPRIQLTSENAPDKSIYFSPFARGMSSKFIVKAPSVGALTQVRISQDATGRSPHWFLERVVVTDLTYPKWTYYFNCSLWLSPQYGDGKTSRLIRGFREPTGVGVETVYRLTFFTGDRHEAGTTADVFVQLYGQAGNGREVWLNRPSWRKDANVASRPDQLPRFDRGTCVEVYLPPCQEYGELRMLKVIVDDLRMHRVFEFPFHNWVEKECSIELGNSQNDETITSSPLKWKSKSTPNHKISTGDLPKAGTSARVYIRLCGPEANHISQPTKKKRPLHRSSSVKSDLSLSHDTSFSDDDETSAELYLTPSIWLTGGLFERSHLARFHIDTPVPVCISPCSNLIVGHDNSGKSPDWYLEEVVIYCPTTGIQQTFRCKQWISANKGDGKIERTLLEDRALRKNGEKLIPWAVVVTTSDVPDAGTSANVLITIYGEKGRSDDISLNSFRLDDQSDWVPEDTKKDSSFLFRPGGDERFRMDLKDVGIPYKLRIGHDNSGSNPGWHLEKVILINLNTDQEYLFPCNRWLSTKEEDYATVREIPAQGPGIIRPLPICLYNVKIFTGNMKNAKTDSNVFINIFGEQGDTGDRQLTRSLKGGSMFEGNQMDEFLVEAVDLKKIRKIRIGHDGTGMHSGWYLAKVVIEKKGDPQSKVTFECHRWFDLKQDDGMIIREFSASNVTDEFVYQVTVVTGKEHHGGTDASVYVHLFGETGELGPVQLRQPESSSNKFETGSMATFNLSGGNTGELKALRISHDGSGMSAGWYLDEVRVLVPHLGQKYTFAAHRWLDKSKEDGKLSIDLQPTRIEKVDRASGSDAREELRSLEDRLDYRRTGPLADIIDGDGLEQYWFLINAWISKNKEDQQIVRDVVATTEDGRPLSRILESSYEIRVKTGSEKVIGFTANVFLTLFGEQSKTGDILLRKTKSGTKPFAHDALDIFEYKAVGVGELKKVRIRHDSTGLNPTWFLDYIVIYETTLNKCKEYLFPCYRCLAKDKAEGTTCLELCSASQNLIDRWKAGDDIRDDARLLNEGNSTSYIINVYTGKDTGAGTDAHVSIQLYGEKESTGVLPLNESRNEAGSKKTNKFENGSLDIFTVKAINVGPLKKIRIGHDSTGVDPSWQLDHLEIAAPKLNRVWVFPCNQWLKRGQKTPAEVELYPKPELTRFQRATSSFEIKIMTSEDSPPFMTAKSFIQIYGKEGEPSSPVALEQAEEEGALFKPNSVNKFYVEINEIVHPVKKIRIWHDESGVNPHWHIRRVELRGITADGKMFVTYVFPCERWLSRANDDGAVERELVPSQIIDADDARQVSIHNLPVTHSLRQYEIKVVTGDVPHAGTDSNVFLTLYGDNGDSGERKLAYSKTNMNKFEKGQTDIFAWEIVDLGRLSKARIRHDNSGVGPSWFLSRIEVRGFHAGKNQPEQQSADVQPVIFHCERWLSIDREDHAIDRILYARDYQMTKATNIRSSSLQTTSDLCTTQGPALPAGVSIFPRKFQGSDDDPSVRALGHVKTVPYHIRVVTGNVKQGGTPGPVWIRCYGKGKTTSGKLMLFDEQLGTGLKKGSSRTFYFDAPTVGEATEFEVCNASVPGQSMGWYLKDLRVDLPTLGTEYHVVCESWLSQLKGDGRTLRCFPVTSEQLRKHPPMKSYQVQIQTADADGAGTDCNIYLQLFGTKGVSQEKFVRKCGNLFERGSLDSFLMEFEDVGIATKLRVRHDAKGDRKDWKLQSIQLAGAKDTYLFILPEPGWLSPRMGDQTVWADLPALVNGVEQLKRVDLKVIVKTSDISGATTDLSVFVRFFGENGDTGDLHLNQSGKNRSLFRQNVRISSDTIKKAFECCGVAVNGKEVPVLKMNHLLQNILVNNSGLVSENEINLEPEHDDDGIGAESGDDELIEEGTSSLEENSDDEDEVEEQDEFVFTEILDPGSLGLCRVWRDDNKTGNSWHCEWIEAVESLPEATPRPARHWRFTCGRWLSHSKEDKLISRDLVCDKEFVLDADGEQIEDPSRVRALLAIAEVASTGSLPDRHVGDIAYDIEIKTGDKTEAGTSDDVWLYMDGSEGKSRRGIFANSNQTPLFQIGQTNKFKLLSPPIGTIKKLHLGVTKHPNKPGGVRSNPSGRMTRETSWFCDSVTVAEPVFRTKYIFKIGQWIDAASDNGTFSEKVVSVTEVSKDERLARVQELKDRRITKYRITVYTGDKLGAGTNANVHITLFSTQPGYDSGRQPLKQQGTSHFERNHVDEFIIESYDLGKEECVKMFGRGPRNCQSTGGVEQRTREYLTTMGVTLNGDIHRILVEEDNTSVGADWFLDKITVTNTNNDSISTFPCEQWFSKNKGDRQLWKELYPA
ncbi:unnamed protein product [Calicophoron daubneyi]|uniref:PLAT domain-containing protein n=1 Tax=Calicophoron daubneyi TaxID=300641 RepID=A0AAV2T1L2_CALDB